MPEWRAGGALAAYKQAQKAGGSFVRVDQGRWEDREIVLELSCGLGEKFVSEKLVGLLRLIHPRVTGVSI